MLVLTREKNESVVIGGQIIVTIVEIRGDRVRLGITAPKSTTVIRKEVHDAMSRPSADRNGNGKDS